MEIETVEIRDNCNIEVKGISFNKRSKYFYASIENTGDADCYLDIEIPDVIVAGEKQTFSMDGVEFLGSKNKKDFKIKAELTEEDFADNENVKVKVYYGERKDSLVKLFEGIFALTIKSTDYLFYSLLVVIIILIILILWKRRKEKEKNRAA